VHCHFLVRSGNCLLKTLAAKLQPHNLSCGGSWEALLYSSISVSCYVRIDMQ
jgi:hypothetical protein